MEKFVFFLSIVLYIVAPPHYSLIFNIVCASLYLLLFLTILKKEISIGFYFSVNTLMGVSLFFATYLYPLFVLPTASIPIFEYYANPCSALVLIAYNLYYLGWAKEAGNQIYTNNYEPSFHFSNKVVSFLNFLSVLLLVYYMLQFRTFMISSDIYTNDIDLGYAKVLIQSVLVVSFVVNAIHHKKYGKQGILPFVKENLIMVSCFAILILTSFLVGDRTIPIYLGICMISSYMFFIRKIKPIVLISTLIIGAAIMVTIGKTRHEDNNFREGGLSSIASTTLNTVSANDNAIELFSDFMPATTALYLCKDYRDSNNGKLYYPLKILKIPFSPIPYLPTYLSKLLYGVENSETSSATLTTAYYNQKVKNIGNSGLGTHAVGDIFISWGFVGLIVFFYLFGRIVGRAQGKIKTSIYWALVYISLCCNSLYIPRASIFDNYRAIMYCFFFLWLSSKITNSKIVYKE